MRPKELWYYYSAACLVPINLLVIYSIFNRPKYDFLEVRDNVHLSRAELARKDKKFLEPTWVEYVYRVYMFFGVLYYIADSVDIMFIRHGVTLNFDVCLWAIFAHHFFTLLTSFWIMRVPHIPWGIGFPLAFHCVLVTWPEETRFHLIYGVVGAVNYFGTMLFIKPFKDSWIYRRVCCTSTPILLSLVAI